MSRVCISPSVICRMTDYAYTYLAEKNMFLKVGIIHEGIH